MGPFSRRRGNLISLLRGLDCFLVTDPNDIFYYTGYMPSGTAFLLACKKCRLFVTSVDNEAEKCGIETVFISGLKDVSRHVKGRVGYDESSLLAEHYKAMKAYMRPSGKTIKQARGVKDKAEIMALKEAVAVTAKAFGRRLDGRAETDVSAGIKSCFMSQGAESAFPPIVSAGLNGYYIHHKPSEYRIKPADMVITDCGAKKTYCADVTRTRFSGSNAKQRAVYEGLAAISDKIMGSIETGMKFAGLQEIYKKEMSRLGYRTMHYIGHSIGLEVHESIGTIQPGNVFTVEPGIYLKGFGGARIEDMVLVKKSGVEILTRKIKK